MILVTLKNGKKRAFHSSLVWGIKQITEQAKAEFMASVDPAITAWDKSEFLPCHTVILSLIKSPNGLLEFPVYEHFDDVQGQMDGVCVTDGAGAKIKLAERHIAHITDLDLIEHPGICLACIQTSIMTPKGSIQVLVQESADHIASATRKLCSRFDFESKN